MNAREIAETVRAELGRRGVRPYRAARTAGLPDNTFRYVLEERDTRLSKLVDVCDALDFEFYIGPRREAPGSRGDAPPSVPVPDLERWTRDLVRLTANAGGDPIPDDLWPVLAVRGNSMHRTLPDGCSILVDRQRTEPVDEAIFVVRAEDGLAVKRARRGDGAGWAFVSEHGSWRPLPRSAVAEVIGQVVWMARALI